MVINIVLLIIYVSLSFSEAGSPFIACLSLYLFFLINSAAVAQLRSCHDGSGRKFTESEIEILLNNVAFCFLATKREI